LGDFFGDFCSIFSNQKISKPEKPKKAVGHALFTDAPAPLHYAEATEMSQISEKTFSR
jgi:hypothetical protein